MEVLVGFFEVDFIYHSSPFCFCEKFVCVSVHKVRHNCYVQSVFAVLHEVVVCFELESVAVPR